MLVIPSQRSHKCNDMKGCIEWSVKQVLRHNFKKIPTSVCKLVYYWLNVLVSTYVDSSVEGEDNIYVLEG